MSNSTSRRRFLFAALGAAIVPLTGCGKSGSESVSTPAPYEGQYKNAKGVVVLEIKEGRVMFTDPAITAKTDAPYSAFENELTVESSSGTFVLTFMPPDTITGLPPAIAGDAGPLKKAS